VGVRSAELADEIDDADKNGSDISQLEFVDEATE
jgi:hypothetical protein